MEFLADTLKFVLAHGFMIEQAPLQTYSTALVFSPINSVIRKQFWNQRLVAIQSIWGTEEYWDPCLQALDCKEYISVAISPDGKILASGSSDSNIRLWDAVTGKETQTLNGHTDTVASVAFSSDGKTLASGSFDDNIRLWDAVTGKERQTLNGHTDAVRSVAFSPDGKTLTSVSHDDTIRLWDVEVRSGKRVARGPSSCVESMAFLPGKGTLVSTARDGTVWKWDIVTGKPRRAWITVGVFSYHFLWLPTNNLPFQSLWDSPGPNAVASSSSVDPILVAEEWILLNGEKLLWLPAHCRPSCWVRDANQLALGLETGGVMLLTFSL